VKKLPILFSALQQELVVDCDGCMDAREIGILGVVQLNWIVAQNPKATGEVSTKGKATKI